MAKVAKEKDENPPRLFVVGSRPGPERGELVDDLACACAEAYGLLRAASIRPMTKEESADYHRYRERIRMICEALAASDSVESVPN